MTTYQVFPFQTFTQPYENYSPDEQSYIFSPSPQQPRSPNDNHTLNSSFAHFHEPGVERDDPAHYIHMKFPIGVPIDFSHDQAAAMRGGQQAIEEHRRAGEGNFSPVSTGSRSPMSTHSSGRASIGLSPIRPSLLPQPTVQPPTPPSSSHSTPSSPPSHSTTTNPSPPRFYCNHPSCFSPLTRLPTRSYSRKADVQRHHRSVHERRYIDCPYKKCTRKKEHGFTRKDHLMEHRRQFHMEDLEKKGGKRGNGVEGKVTKMGSVGHKGC